MKVIDYWQNADGSWTGVLWSLRFTGTYEQVRTWISSNGEMSPSNSAGPRT